MSLLFWTHKEPPTDRTKSEVPVSEQDPLPGALYWRGNDTLEFEEVQPGHPWPVADPRRVKGSNRPQVAASASAPTLILAPNPSRKQVKITNTTGTQAVWIATFQNVTATNGDYLAASAGSNVVYDCTDGIWGLSVTSAQTLAIFETEYVSG